MHGNCRYGKRKNTISEKTHDSCRCVYDTDVRPYRIDFVNYPLGVHMKKKKAGFLSNQTTCLLV